MIAADSSSVIAFLEGELGDDVDRINAAMSARSLRLPPPVISELRSSPRNTPHLLPFIRGVQILPILDGFWERVGDSRRLLRSKGLKAALADAMVAQVCVDLDIPLITRDGDFRHFERWSGLKLAR